MKNRPWIVTPYQAPPQLPRQHQRARPQLQPQYARALPPPPLPQPIPQALPTMIYTSPQGIAAMPSKQSKLAPHFTGKVEHPIEDFLDEYKELVDKCGLTGPQKVETVIQYVNCSEHHVWQALPGYINHNWDELCNELHEEYMNPTTEGQFSKQKLLDFTSKYAWKHMSDETDVINYQHKFNSLGKTLLGSGCITKGEYNAIFWRRFHPEDRQELHERLIAKHPDKPKGQAFSIKDVLKIARAVFSGDNDFLLQELPLRNIKSDRAQRTKRSMRNQQESDHDRCASRRRRAHDPSPDQQHSKDEEALYIVF